MKARATSAEFVISNAVSGGIFTEGREVIPYYVLPVDFRPELRHFVGYVDGVLFISKQTPE